MLKEFSTIFILNLRGDAVASGDLRRAEGGNIFENKIKEGVAISFFIRNSSHNSRTVLKIYEIPPGFTYDEKKNFIEDATFQKIKFDSYKLDSQLRWIPSDAEESRYSQFVPLIDKAVKSAKVKGQDQAIFKTFANGMNSARDNWAYDFEENQLRAKIKFFSQVYNRVAVRASGKSFDETARMIDGRIKWSRDLIQRASSGAKISHGDAIDDLMFRPFSKRKAYMGSGVIDVRSLKSTFFPEEANNVAICINRNGKNFESLATSTVPDWHFIGDTTYFGRDRFVDGVKFDNVTDWALDIFRKHYGDNSLTKDHVFWYCYAILNMSSFIKEFSGELNGTMPRIPLLKGVLRWSAWGRKLVDLHANYVTVQPDEKIKVLSKKGTSVDPILRFLPTQHRVILDDCTTIDNLHDDLNAFKIGSRNPVEWVLESYRPATFNIHREEEVVLAKNFSAYPWTEIKSDLIDLIPRLSTVAERTQIIKREMEAEYAMSKT